MDRSVLIEIGPVDTSIIEIAKLNTGSYKHFIVLTSDYGVFKRCEEEQVSVQWTEETIKQFVKSF